MRRKGEPMTDFTGVEAEFERLKGRFESGDLTESDLKARLEELMVEDEQGRWWMIGYETGQWYVHDGEKWVRQEPPRAARGVPDLPAGSQPQATMAVPTEMLGAPKATPSPEPKLIFPEAAAPVHTEGQAAQKAATNALCFAIAGLFICGVILEPIAILQARKARKALGPGEPGHRKAVAAEIIAWIGLVLWLLLCLIWALGSGLPESQGTPGPYPLPTSLP
jgi:hypothetical protein